MKIQIYLLRDRSHKTKKDGKDFSLSWLNNNLNFSWNWIGTRRLLTKSEHIHTSYPKSRSILFPKDEKEGSVTWRVNLKNFESQKKSKESNTSYGTLPYECKYIIHNT